MDRSEDLQKSGKLPTRLTRLCGAFSVSGGAIVAAQTEEPTEGAKKTASPDDTNRTDDQEIADDPIVQGSIEVGFDAVNGYSFGFDTLVLAENTLRIYFYDTSSSTGFPTTDWRLTANDSISGGAGCFSIDDVTSGTVPFKIEAGVPTSSLYVEESGEIGMGTSNPAQDIHIAVGDTRTVRLDQNGSLGWAPQVWDVAGNEANFFVRDTTGGSILPFRIRPGAPSNSIYVHSDGTVGLGTNTPASALSLLRTDGTAKMTIQEQNAEVTQRTLLLLENTGAIAT